eukprot:5634465-Prymnesium_polylepis.1
MVMVRIPRAAPAAPRERKARNVRLACTMPAAAGRPARYEDALVNPPCVGRERTEPRRDAPAAATTRPPTSPPSTGHTRLPSSPRPAGREGII